MAWAFPPSPDLVVNHLARDIERLSTTLTAPIPGLLDTEKRVLADLPT